MSFKICNNFPTHVSFKLALQLVYLTGQQQEASSLTKTIPTKWLAVLHLIKCNFLPVMPYGWLAGQAFTLSTTILMAQEVDTCYFIFAFAKWH